MNWLLYALISSLSFGTQGTVSYKLLDVEKFSSGAVNTVVHCLFVIVGFLLLTFLGKKNILRDIGTILHKYTFLITLAGICALLGNVLLYWSYQLGSDINPGIITTLGDGAMIISTVLAYIFYNAKVSLKNALGIFILMISFGMIAMGDKLLGDKEKNNTHDDKKHEDKKHEDKKHEDKKHHDKKHHDKKKTKTHSWLIIALLSAIAYGGLSFFQYVITKKDKKLNMIALAMCVGIIESIIGIVIYLLVHFNSFRGIEQGPFKNYKEDIGKLSSIEHLPLTLGAALLDGLGLTTLLKSYTLAKNPGFSDAISDTYSIPQSILTYLFYNKNMDAVQISSIFVAIIGSTLLTTK